MMHALSFAGANVTAASFPPPPNFAPIQKSSLLSMSKFALFKSRPAKSTRCTPNVDSELHITHRETWTAPAGFDSNASNSHHPSISQVLYAPAPTKSTTNPIEPTYYRMELREEEMIKIEEQWTKELSEYSSENASPRSSITSDDSVGDIGTLVDFSIDGGDSTAEESEDEDVYDKQMKIWDESLWVVRQRAVAEEEELVIDWGTYV